MTTRLGELRLFCYGFAMLVDAIRKRAAAAVKQGDSVARDVLRLALGEIQTADSRRTEPGGDGEAAAVLRKLIKSNDETLAALSPTGDERIATLKHENEVLASLLPQQLSVAQIIVALTADTAAIQAAGSDGQAIGLATKRLKAAGADAKGADVGLAVKEMRRASSS